MADRLVEIAAREAAATRGDIHFLLQALREKDAAIAELGAMNLILERALGIPDEPEVIA